MLDFLKLLIPSRDQMASYIRSGFKIVGGAMAAHGVALSPDVSAAVAGPEAIQVYTGIAMAIIPMVVDGFVHSVSGRLKSASDVHGIKPIEVLPGAPPEVKAVADDPKIPNVKSAASAYSPPPIQRK
jgi:hypothetical protein